MLKEKIPFAKYQLFSLMDWLDQRAQEGNVIQTLSAGTALFEEGDKARRKYLFAPEDKESEALLQEARFEKVQSYAFGLALYMTGAKQPKLPNEPKSLEDDAILRTMERAKRSGRRPYIAGIFAFVLLFTAAVSYYGGRFAFFLQKDAALGLIPLMIGLLAVCIQGIHRVNKEIGAYQKLLTGQGLLSEIEDQLRLSHEAPSKEKPIEKEMGLRETLKRLSLGKKILVGLLALEVVLVLAGLLRHQTGSLSKASFDYFSLSNVAQGELKEVVVEDYGNTYTLDGSLLIPWQLETRQSAGIEDNRTVAMRTLEYRCLTKGLAHDLLVGSARTQLSWNPLANAEPLTEAPFAGQVDEAYKAGYQSMQYLFLRKGNKVLLIFYLGDVSLTEVGEKIVEYMNQ